MLTLARRGRPTEREKKGVSLEGNHQNDSERLELRFVRASDLSDPIPVVPPSQLPVWPEWYPAPSPLAA